MMIMRMIKEIVGLKIAIVPSQTPRQRFRMMTAHLHQLHAALLFPNHPWVARDRMLPLEPCRDGNLLKLGGTLLHQLKIPKEGLHEKKGRGKTEARDEGTLEGMIHIRTI